MSIVQGALGLKVKNSSAHGAGSTGSQASDNTTTAASQSESSGKPNSKHAEETTEEIGKISVTQPEKENKGRIVQENLEKGEIKNAVIEQSFEIAIAPTEKEIKEQVVQENLEKEETKEEIDEQVVQENLEKEETKEEINEQVVQENLEEEETKEEIDEYVVQENLEKEEINDLEKGNPRDNVSEARIVEFTDHQVNERPKTGGPTDETSRNSDNIHQTPSFPNNDPETIFHLRGEEMPSTRNVGIHQIPAAPNSPQNRLNVVINNNYCTTVEINNYYINALHILLIIFVCILSLIFYCFHMSIHDFLYCL